jgi:fructoselysine-6-P-deglycase FrlB-like protein
MSWISTEVHAQPSAWRQAASLMAQVRPSLPRPGDSVAVVGCGTSWFMAQSYALLRESAGEGLTDAFAASEFPGTRQYDHVLAITRSGTTTEVLRLLDQVSCLSTAITADGSTPVAAAADHVIELAFAEERSVVQTVFATTALMVLRASLGADIDALSAQAEAVLTEAPAAALVVAEQVTFLGAHWAFGIAQEAALKLREATQMWTESYPAMEYRHGPIAIAQPGRVVWALGEVEQPILDAAASAGALVVSTPADPVVELVRVHQVAIARAEAQGLDPDRPRNLTRSVVLST